MEFNLSTFVLEIINFLVLLWILQRLFYKPLLEVITRRKQFIDKSLSDAKNLQQQAEQQRSLYESRQKLWEQEKQVAITALHQQFEMERQTQLGKLNSELEQERQKALLTLSKQQQEQQQSVEKQALKNAAKFAGLLVQQAAGPELEARLVRLLLDQLASLPDACQSSLMLLETKKSVSIKISSAYPLSTEMRSQLELTLGMLINSLLDIQYLEDTTLIAGLRLDIGAWVLNTNLQHELIGFAELAYDAE